VLSEPAHLSFYAPGEFTSGPTAEGSGGADGAASFANFSSLQKKSRRGSGAKPLKKTVYKNRFPLSQERR